MRILKYYAVSHKHQQTPFAILKCDEQLKSIMFRVYVLRNKLLPPFKSETDRGQIIGTTCRQTHTERKRDILVFTGRSE